LAIVIRLLQIIEACPTYNTRSVVQSLRNSEDLKSTERIAHE